jgi:hypothetical protein
MKTSPKNFCHSARLVIIIMTLLFYDCTNVPHLVKQKPELLISTTYQHFEGGVLFPNVDMGLEILWKASFNNKKPYKENLALFVEGGLLILPNKNNTLNSASFAGFRFIVQENKLFVEHRDELLEVFGIIHTHIDPYCLPTPAPKNDYQFGYLGIHNYVMSVRDLYDAFKDAAGNEDYERLGARDSYTRIEARRKSSKHLVAID